MKILGKEISKKMLIIIIASIVIVGSGVTTGVILMNNKDNQKQEEKQKDTILLKEDLKFEINSEVKLLSLVSEDNKVKILSEDETIDTSTLGEKEITIKYEVEEKEETKTFKITIEDTQAPTIEYQKELSTNVGSKIDLLKGVKVSDNSGEEIKVTVEGEYDVNTPGEYQLKYSAVDSSGNKSEKDFKLIVKEKEKPKQQEVKQNNTSKSNKTTSSNSNNNNTYTETPQQNTTCKTLQLYTFVDENTWRTDSCNHIRQITYYWYVNYIQRDIEGNVYYVEWGVSCDSGAGMPAVEKAKSHMPAPPSGQSAVDMYNQNNKVHYGATVLYTVIP